MSRSSRPASGPASVGSAKLPPPRASGVMIWRATPRTCWATSSETTTCCPVAWAKSHAWTRNSMDRMPRAAPAGISCGPTLTSPSSPRTCQASSVAWAAVATRASSGLVTGPAPGAAPAAAPRYVTDPIRWSASWVTSNSVHTVGLMVVGLGDTAQDQLADGQRGLGGAERIEGGLRRPLVGSGVPGGGGGDEATEVVRPARGVAGLLLAGQSLVRPGGPWSRRGGLQRDDHGRGARR